VRTAALALCLLAAGSAGAEIPPAVCGATGDAWDPTVFAGQAAPCQNIRSQLALRIPATQEAAAERLLARQSARALSDEATAALLQQASAKGLFSNLLNPLIDRLWAQRTVAIEGRRGGWSDADTVTVSDLVDLLAPHYPPYRPYLVRGLAGDPAAQPGSFEVHLCGEVLTVASITRGEHVVRTPLIVFLQSPPRTSVPTWCR
jgi:hypothetical protein